LIHLPLNPLYTDRHNTCITHWRRHILRSILFTASLLLAACALPIASPTASLPTTTPGPQIISFKTDAGLTLAGTLYGSGSNAVILSNVGDGTQPDWLTLPNALAQRGYLVLTFDWRGLGLSQGKLDYTLSPLDLKAAIDFMRSRGATKFILDGASLGGMASLKNASIDELAGVIVMGSPRQVPNLVISIAELQAIRVPKLFIASQQDTVVKYADTQELYQLANEPKLLKSYAGSAHGTALLKTGDQADLMKAIIDFITTTLPN
jgi:alpha/beta superfamily hydrolase